MPSLGNNHTTLASTVNMEQRLGLLLACVLLGVAYVSTAEHEAEHYSPEEVKKAPLVGYTSWTKFGECTRKCGSGKQTRVRSCIGHTRHCSGALIELRKCNLHHCPVHGGYSKWGHFGSCSRSCGGGVQKRIRTCTNPRPRYGGRKCSGPSRGERKCNLHHCPVHGGYSKWGHFGSCSRSCGGGVQKRSRTCTNPRPRYGGRKCSGPSGGERKCNIQPCLKKVHCSVHYTPFNDDGRGRPIYLDRHQLTCPHGTVMNTVKYERNKAGNKIRFKYKCCTSRLTCKNQPMVTKSTINGGVKDHISGRTIYLDRQEISCPRGSAISSLKLHRSGVLTGYDRFYYRYSCCKVTYPKVIYSCRDRNTGFNSSGNNISSHYLDRHNVQCPRGDEFITYMRLVRDKSGKNYRYNYKCCYINPPNPMLG